MSLHELMAILFMRKLSCDVIDMVCDKQHLILPSQMSIILNVIIHIIHWNIFVEIVVAKTSACRQSFYSSLAKVFSLYLQILCISYCISNVSWSWCLFQTQVIEAVCWCNPLNQKHNSDRSCYVPSSTPDRNRLAETDHLGINLW